MSDIAVMQDADRTVVEVRASGVDAEASGGGPPVTPPSPEPQAVAPLVRAPSAESPSAEGDGQVAREPGETRPLTVGARLGAPSPAPSQPSQLSQLAQTSRATRIEPMSVAASDRAVLAGAGTTASAPMAASERSEAPKTAAEFAVVLARVDEAARDWGLRSDTAEGRFVSAMMGGISWVGHVSEAAQASFNEIAEEHRKAAEAELARAKEITKGLSASLVQSRNAMINLQVERETVVARMLTDTMPMFADKLKDAVVIREKSELEGARFKRLALTCVLSLCVFLMGYGVRAWADGSELDALGRCLAHPIYAPQHAFCDITNFAPAAVRQR